ncbi:MAG TPA: response regulator [Acidimicrobiia bacterium]|nr:response regulator [Acidimicrobiia bacterium]
MEIDAARTRFGRIVRTVARQSRIVVIITAFVIVISSMVGYNALALSHERGTPLIVDVTSRQRAFVESYIKDVTLKLDGQAADPSEDAEALKLTANSLLHGGDVPSPQGGLDDLVPVPPPASPAIRVKLAHEQDLIHQLVDQGTTLLTIGHNSPSYQPTLFLMRVTGAQLSSVTGDVAGEEALVAHERLSRLVTIELALGLLGALAAVGMGLLLWLSARKQSARFRSLVHNSLDLITVVDDHSIALYQSPSSTRVVGYEPADVLGTKLTDLLHPNDKTRVIQAFADIFDRPDETAAVKFRLRHRDGTWVTMEGTVLNLVHDATVGGFVVNSRDVTERDRVEAELAAARDSALDASRMKSQFLASMSHEIRTPMNAVIGLTELLLDTPLTSEQRRYAGGVGTAADGLLGIINDILDFSKVEAGKLEVEAVDLDLGMLLEDVVGLFAETAQSRDLELLVHRHVGLPTALRGDPTRLRQVLVNLMSNAVKFTAEGEVVLAASLVRDDPQTAVVRFEVSDTGLGIAPEDQLRMFDAFSQADSSTTRRFGGTGLGLAIVRQLVELMGGHLGLDSEVDRGSTFWFELPLEKQDAVELSTDPQIRDLSSLRVLVVDDNATNRLILHQQLASWGMDSDEEPSAPAALARMKTEHVGGRRYDIVVLDLNMPEMDGLELARLINNDTDLAEAKLFLLSSSGKVSAQVASEFRLSGALAKPVRQSELFDCLVAGLEGTTDFSGGPAPTTTRSRPDAVRRSGHILLVEDNAMNQLVATKILEKIGYSVDVAENGHVALAQIDANVYDAVLMDCQMPEMDGYEATRQLRRRELDRGGREHLTVVAMTAAAMDGDRERCLAAGMDDYVTKPVRASAVDAVLARWIAEPGDAPADAEVEPPEADFPLDPARLAMLRELDGGDGSLISAVVSEFVGDSTRQIVAVTTALRHGDSEVIERAVHTLRGASANLGATTLADLCGELEALARASALGMAPEVLDSIRSEHTRVCSALDAVFVQA